MRKKQTLFISGVIISGLILVYTVLLLILIKSKIGINAVPLYFIMIGSAISVSSICLKYFLNQKLAGIFHFVSAAYLLFFIINLELVVRYSYIGVNSDFLSFIMVLIFDLLVLLNFLLSLPVFKKEECPLSIKDPNKDIITLLMGTITSVVVLIIGISLIISNALTIIGFRLLFVLLLIVGSLILNYSLNKKVGLSLAISGFVLSIYPFYNLFATSSITNINIKNNQLILVLSYLYIIGYITYLSTAVYSGYFTDNKYYDNVIDIPSENVEDDEEKEEDNSFYF